VRVHVGDLSEEHLKRRDSLLTPSCAARRPPGRLELRNVVRYEPLDGLLGIWAAEAHVAHVRDVEEPVHDEDREDKGEH
jgi:hypothetical protein